MLDSRQLNLVARNPSSETPHHPPWKRTGQLLHGRNAGSNPTNRQVHSPRLDNPSAWRAELETQVDAFCDRWEALLPNGTGPSPFHRSAWLRDWYATLGRQSSLQPVLVRVTTAHDGQDRLLLPLVRKSQAGMQLLLPADQGVTDYNGPLLQPELRLDAPQARAMWSALRTTLARQGDLLRINKMLPDLSGVPNPLALALRHRPSPSTGHVFRVNECWETWRHSLKRQARRESERHWRVFQSYPSPRLELVTDPQRAMALLEALDEMQRMRLAPRGPYVLDAPDYRAFYRRRLVTGLADGTVVLTALTSGDDSVAVALGVRNGVEFTLLRVGFAGDQWKSCAPGRLLMEHSARLMWDLGCREFDLSIGSYAYKQTFGCEPRPLLEICTPLSWRGLPAAWAWHGKQWLEARQRRSS